MSFFNRHTTQILVVEDSLPDRRLIEEYFKEISTQRYVLHHAETLTQCKQYLSSHDINLVLLDLNLPDSHGLDTFEQLSREFPAMPVVVLTGRYAEDESIGIRSIEKGAQEFLSKTELSSQILQRTVNYAIQRKQMMRRLEQAHQMAKMGSWDLDLQANELSCSAALNHIFEVDSPHGFRHFGDYLAAVHPEDQEKVARRIKEACHTQSSFHVDHRILLSGGRIKHISLQGQMEETPHHRGSSMVGTIQDITDRVQVEELTRQKELADKTAKLRQEFLAKTSHEIRTPLNPILVLTDMLLRTDLNPEQREYLDIIRTAGDTLLALVNDILDLSKIEAGKIEFNYQPFNFNKVFDFIRDMMDINAKEKALELCIDIDPDLPEVVEGDPVRLTQILLNLVGNAIKFTHEGRIEVTVKGTKQTQDALTLSFVVKDTGIGIPKDKLKVIFESFQQVESNATRQYGGTGLGLTIVRQLVLLQQGHIHVESELGRGSTFFFDLPFGLPNREAEPESTADRAAPTHSVDSARPLDQSLVAGLRILLVEDNPLNQMVTKKLLSDWGIETDVANNGREGITLMQEQTFDLVLMDVQMPEMDGYEATRYIREKLPAPKCQVPIVALTANAFTGSDDECLRAGMDDYLSKPIEIGNLFDKIVTHICFKQPSAVRRMLQPVTIRPQSELSATKSTNGTHHSEPAPIPVDPMPQNTYTDLSYLSELSGGEPDVIKAAVAKFVDSTPEMLDQLDEHLAKERYVDLGKTAHKLKSSVAFMGITSIHDTIVKVETIAKSDGDKSPLPALVAEIRSVVQASFDELRTTVAQM